MLSAGIPTPVEWFEGERGRRRPSREVDGIERLTTKKPTRRAISWEKEKDRYRLQIVKDLQQCQIYHVGLKIKGLSDYPNHCSMKRGYLQGEHFAKQSPRV